MEKFPCLFCPQPKYVFMALTLTPLHRVSPLRSLPLSLLLTFFPLLLLHRNKSFVWLQGDSSPAASSGFCSVISTHTLTPLPPPTPPPLLPLLPFLHHTARKCSFLQPFIPADVSLKIGLTPYVSATTNFSEGFKSYFIKMFCHFSKNRS